MWQSLLIKLGMFAATMGVVFWIGWTLPPSFDRSRDLATISSEDSAADRASGGEDATEMRSSSVATSTRDTPRASLVRRYTCSIIGRPASSARGLPGNRVDSYLAGMTTMLES